MMGLIKPAILNRSDNNYIYNFNLAGATDRHSIFKTQLIAT